MLKKFELLNLSPCAKCEYSILHALLSRARHCRDMKVMGLLVYLRLKINKSFIAFRSGGVGGGALLVGAWIAALYKIASLPNFP